MQDFAAVHTTHAGNFANSSKSSVAAEALVPAVWAETVKADSSIAAMVARCMLDDLERRMLQGLDA